MSEKQAQPQERDIDWIKDGLTTARQIMDGAEPLSPHVTCRVLSRALIELDRLRAQPSPREVALREALIDAVAHLDAATSAYRKYAKRHASLGKADADPFYGTRIKDFANAVVRLRRALASDGREG